MNRYRVEFTENDSPTEGPARYAITFQAESKEEAAAVLSHRKPLAWDVRAIEIGGSE